MATVEVDVDTSQARFEKSDYAQVIFHNIAETYPTDANIDCHFTVTSNLVPSSRDWVGLYKVGWSSSREYIYFEWSPKPSDYQSGIDTELHIVFAAKKLPKDDGEFYQFCYVTYSGQVRGASTPFQFKQPSADDFVAIQDEEDQDFLVVKSKTLALEEDLLKAVLEKENMQKNKAVLESERESLLEKIVECERKIAAEQKTNQTLTTQLKSQNEKISCLDHEAQDMNLVLESLTEKISCVNKEKDEILRRLDENDQYIKQLRTEIKTLTNERDTLSGRVKGLEEEKELFKNHFTTSEATLQGYQIEVDGLKRQAEEKDRECLEEAKTVNMLQEQLETEKEKVNHQLVINDTQRDHINELSERLKNQEDKLAAAELCKQMLNEEVTSIQLAHKKMSDGFEAAKLETDSLKDHMAKVEEQFASQENLLLDEMVQLKGDLEAKQKENSELQKEVAVLNSKKEETEQRAAELQKKVVALTAQMEEMEQLYKSESEGPLYALKTAQAHLKERYAKMKLQNDDIKKQLDELLHRQQTWKQKEKDLQREIVDLKERLQMGAEEYKVKYIECKKLQLEVKKLQKQVTERRRERKISNDVVVEIEPPLHTEAPSDNKKENVSQTDKPETQEGSTETTPEMEKILEMSTSEFQAQLDDLSSELETRNQKKQKYKQLYQDEHEKRIFLEKHYYEEMKKAQEEVIKVKAIMEEEVNRVKAGMEDQQCQHRNRVDDLQVIIKKQRDEIAQLRENLVKMQPGTVYPDDSFSSSHNEPPFTLKYGNPYEKEVSEAAAAAVASPPTEMTDSADALGDVSTYEDLATPLKPLPAPLLPEVLPSAKVAAVRAVCEGGNKPEALVDEHFDGIESTDGDEERFLDADGEPQKICPLCSMTFPTDHPIHMLESHIASHYGPVCPMCSVQFAKDTDPHVFEMHVQTHFDEME